MTIKIIILLITITIALYTDVMENKIKNKYLLPAFILGIITSFVFGGFEGLKSSLIGVIIPFIILFILFIFRFMGAGDIKLYCTIGAIMGHEFLINNLMYTIFVGGVLALVILLISKNLISRLRRVLLFIVNIIISKNIMEYEGEPNSKKMPFAIAIFIGTVLQLIIRYNFF